MKVKEESEKVSLKLNIQKTNIMASGPIWTSLWVSSMCKEFMTYRHLRKAFHTKDQDRQTWKGTPAAAEAGRGQKERWLPSVSREKRPWDAATREARRRATGERNRWNGTTNPAKPTGDWQEFQKQIKTKKKGNYQRNNTKSGKEKKIPEHEFPHYKDKQSTWYCKFSL